MTAEHRVRTAAPTAVVVVVDGRWSGALAYALERALEQPCRVRMVCTPADALSVANVPVPIEMADPSPSGTLSGIHPLLDMIVAEGSPSTSDATPTQLARLRDECECLLVEVTSEGRLFRVSGPSGWAYDTERPVEPTPEPSPSLAWTGGRP